VTTAAMEQQRVEELCAASIRALSGESDVHFRGRRLYRGGIPVPLHAPHQQLEGEEHFADRRGVSDGVALRIRHSNAALHAKLCPSDPVARLVFEMLEQFRVESLVAVEMPGARSNLDQRFERWSDSFAHSGLVDTDLGLLMFAVAQICRSRLHGVKVPEPYEDLLEPTRAGMAPLLGHDLAAIRALRHDQAAFAAHALSIAWIVSASVTAAEAGVERRAPRDDERRAIFSLSLDFEDEEGEVFSAAQSGHSKVLEASEHGYQVFTRAYDRTVQARELVRETQLKSMRAQLDEQLREQRINVPRLARLFRAMLAQPEVDGRSFGEESGYIDGRRLSQLIVSPGERRVFQEDRQLPLASCRFTILVDCSGSMKQYIDRVACLVDVMLRSLELAGARTELLGFTTNAWSGGRAQRDWIRQGRPANPGRLNETCHIVFKDAETTWRRARPSVAALSKRDLFREGIDGEAVDWACRRLVGDNVRRNILMVISDGSPMDTATALANDPFYLDNHLQRVLARWQTTTPVEIFGLGVGLDLSPYYDRSLAVDLSQGLSHQLFIDILEVLRGHHRR
jgi:cobaltochelatase CobT